MLTLWRKFNYRNVKLEAGLVGEKAGVLQSDGSMQLSEWQGFISPGAARAIDDARSVRRVINRIEDLHTDQFLKPGEYVQGCAVGRRVWAILDSKVRVVKGPLQREHL